MNDVDEHLAAWKAFAARVTLTFPFRIDVTTRIDNRPPPHGDRVQVGVEFHVLDRNTREPIIVRTRRHVGAWVSDEAGLNLIFDLLEIALRHETYESVRLDGKLTRELHKHLESTEPRDTVPSMKHTVFTCFRCGTQAKVPPDNDDVPLEWAQIHYERFHELQENGETVTGQTMLKTHACGECAKAVLDYLETPMQSAPA